MSEENRTEREEMPAVTVEPKDAASQTPAQIGADLERHIGAVPPEFCSLVIRVLLQPHDDATAVQ